MKWAYENGKDSSLYGVEVMEGPYGFEVPRKNGTDFLSSCHSCQYPVGDQVKGPLYSFHVWVVVRGGDTSLALLRDGWRRFDRIIDISAHIRVLYERAY